MKLRNGTRFARIGAALGSLCALLGLVLGGVFAAGGRVEAQTLGQHCYDVGPLPGIPDWCGCTWGAVYVDRQPVAGATVNIHYAGKTMMTTSRLAAAETFPYYALNAHDLGAKYGDTVTLTVTYEGQTLTRTVRLLPNASGEQQASFAFPASGHWEHWANLSNVQAIAARGSDLWIGAASALVRWEITTGISETLTTGLASPGIQALAIGPDGSTWAGSTAGLARYHQGEWSVQATGLASPNIRALAVGPQGDVWAGASGATTGGVSRFIGGAWQSQPDFNGPLPNAVLSLAAGDAGRVWVGTDDAGASYWDGASWRTFRTEDGLASNIVYGIAAGASDVWFATFSYFDGTGAHGGAGRYDPASAAWSRYTTAQGLAFDDLAAVAIDDRGRKWFGTWGGGLSLFDGRNWWTFDETAGLSSNYVRALAVGPDGSLWAGAQGGVDRFRPGPGGTAPAITTASVTPAGLALEFRAQAADPDGGPIASYEWRSDVDGSLGSEAAFTLPARRLTPGAHTIAVRAVDDDGQWSAERAMALAVDPPSYVYLPTVIR